MPITVPEWDSGSLSATAATPDVEPVAGTDEPRIAVRSFLRSNPDVAFTRAEVVRGVHCSDRLDARQVGEILAELPNQLADLAADFESGGIAVSAYSEAVDALRSDGIITCAHIERRDGEPVVYYRWSGDDAAGQSCRR